MADPTDPATPAGPAPTDPTPPTPAGPAPAPATTIGDLIAADLAAADAKSRAVDLVASANATLTSAAAAADRADAALSAGIAQTGQVYRVLPDSMADVYAPDGAGSFTTHRAKPVTTPVDLPPA